MTVTGYYCIFSVPGKMKNKIWNSSKKIIKIKRPMKLNHKAKTFAQIDNSDHQVKEQYGTKMLSDLYEIWIFKNWKRVYQIFWKL